MSRRTDKTANNLNRNYGAYGAPPPGTALYDKYRDMSYVNGTFTNGRQPDAVSIVKRSGRKFEEIGIGAYNTDVAGFYRVALLGKAGQPVFPTPGAKKYFIRCLAGALPYYPVEIQSFSVINNSAYFVAASFDQTEISLRRYFALVATTYADYYNEVFDHSGNPFRSRPAIKRIKGADDVAEQIVLVSRQPYVRREAAPGRKYPFCSAGDEGGLTSRTAFEGAFGKEGLASLKAAESDAARPIFSLDLAAAIFTSFDKLDDAVENTLIDFGCFTKKKIPNDVMPKICAEINERSAAPFDKICKKLAISGREKYILMLKTLQELIVSSKRTFDYAWDALELGVYDKKSVAIDVIIDLSDRLGYSIDQLFAMMGFAYCAVVGGKVEYYNDALVVEIIRFIARSRRQPVQSVIESLGIRNSFEDPDRVKTVAMYCR